MAQAKRWRLVAAAIFAALVNGNLARAQTAATTTGVQETFKVRQAINKQLIPSIVQGTISAAQDAPQDASRNVNVSIPLGGGVLQIVGVIEGSSDQSGALTVQSFLTITQTNISVPTDSGTYVINGIQPENGSTTFTKTGTKPPLVVSGTISVKGQVKITPPTGPTVPCPIDVTVNFGNGGGFTWSGTLCGAPIPGSGSLNQ